MPSNPMQRKVRNSYLLGILTMLIVVILLAIIAYFLVLKPAQEKRKKEEELKGLEVSVSVLSRDVKSGDVITPGQFTTITAYANSIPSNYVDPALLSTLQLQDENGNLLFSDENGKLYMSYPDNTTYKTVDNSHNDRILIEQDELGYYRTIKVNNEHEYIKLIDVPTVAKVDLKKNTILTTDFIAKSNEIPTDSLRYVEYNIITMPTLLESGDFVDIRLKLPNSQDLIVVSKKEVQNVYGQTLGMNLTEEEILLLNSAIVESYIMSGSQLYATIYVEPGLQNTAIYTYSPTEEVAVLINNNPNIVETARASIYNRYLGSGAIRNPIITERNKYTEERQQTSISQGMQQQIDAAIQARQNYLSELNGY